MAYDEDEKRGFEPVYVVFVGRIKEDNFGLVLLKFFLMFFKPLCKI